jgi:demethylmenaquinone methyltransferase/2-methoxy-6-polyprenyl-1,4-benzoquinol methylase
MDYHEHMKQYYDRLAFEYEENEASREEPAEDLPGLFHAISLLRQATVLDVACGTGFFTQHLGSEVTGLDQSEAMLKVARERVPWAEFVRGDAFRMPFAERCFGRIFASFFYGLLPLEDRGRFLEEARRVGEELILVEPTPEWVPSGRAEGWEERGLSDGSRYEIYRRYFTAETFTEELDGRILFAGRWMVMAKVGR